MKPINTKVFVLIALFYTSISWTQTTNKPYDKSQNFISIGIAKPFLMDGYELLRSKDIRSQGLSYYEDEAGGRKQVGTYSDQIGWNIGLGLYNPIKKVNRLMWGSEFSMSLTGSDPADGYQEAYYFNYLSFNFGLKYYPLSNANLFIKANGGMGGVMTKNRFINELNEQNFFHQFGIGVNGAASLGYSFVLTNTPLSAIEIGIDYKLSNVRVEVNGFGNDQWTYSSLDLRLGLNF